MSTIQRQLPAGYKERGAPVTGRVLQTGSELSTDEFGLDVLTRPYLVRTDMAPQLLPREGEVDFQYRDLTFSTYRLTELPNFWSRLSIEYVGHVNGYRRSPQGEPGRRREYVQLKTTEDEDVEVEYFTPYTTYRYVSNGEPRKPRFNGPMIFGPDEISLGTERPARRKGRLMYRYENVLEEWSGRPRGRYYEVTEVWTMRLLPDTDRRPKLLFKWQSVGATFGALT